MECPPKPQRDPHSSVRTAPPCPPSPTLVHCKPPFLYSRGPKCHGSVVCPHCQPWARLYRPRRVVCPESNGSGSRLTYRGPGGENPPRPAPKYRVNRVPRASVPCKDGRSRDKGRVGGRSVYRLPLLRVDGRHHCRSGTPPSTGPPLWVRSETPFLGPVSTGGSRTHRKLSVPHPVHSAVSPDLGLAGPPSDLYGWSGSTAVSVRPLFRLPARGRVCVGVGAPEITRLRPSGPQDPFGLGLRFPGSFPSGCRIRVDRGGTFLPDLCLPV